MGAIPIAIIAAGAMAGGAAIYGAKKQADAQEEASRRQVEAMEEQAEEQRRIQAEAERRASEEALRLKTEQERIAAEEKAKEEKAAQLRGQYEENLKSGRRALLLTGKDVWESAPNVQRKTLLGA